MASGDNSTLTHPEISLGSFDDDPSQKTPAKLRVPSSSSGTSAQSSQPVATPSPPVFSRRTTVTAADKSGYFDPANEDDGTDYGVGTPVATRPKRTARASASAAKGALTLRDQEKHIDNLKKENFNIKLRVHFLEERLAQLAPDQIDAALKQNISLKIEVQQRGMELKKLKKLVLELERELERLQRAGANTHRSGTRDRERELEEKLEERDRELRELRRRAADDSADALLADRNAELEDELDNMRGLLEDNMDELERLRDIVERRDSEADGGRVASLEAANAELLARAEEQADLAGQREEEKEDLADLVEQLRLENEELAQQLQRAEALERSESRAMILEEREEREAVEDELGTARDKLAAALIELQQKEDELEMKNTEIDELVAEHERVVAVVEEEWRGEVEEARGQVEELRDVLAERESESKDLRLNISELEANTDDLHSKFEAALAHLEEETEAKDAEIESMGQTIEKLGEQIYVLEDENDRLKEDSDRMREDEAAERERLEALTAALKDKIASLKAELEDMTQMYEACSGEIHCPSRPAGGACVALLRTWSRSFKLHVRQPHKATADADAAAKAHASALRAERRTLDAKESALQSALADLARTQALLGTRDADLAAVQAALQTLEGESRKAGETHSSARFSLELEVDRVKRDLERVEAELAAGARGRGRDEVIDAMHAEILELKGEVGAQTQARLNVSERLDGVQTSLKAAELEVAGYKKRVADLEARLSKDQRALLAAESQYRDQLTERNTLLLTIYQYMDKILGVDKTPKKAGQAETKPFTNFGVFHDNLITRLKALSQIQTDFERRAKDVEARFMDRLNEMRKQLDMRWKQIDKFEAGVKGYADAKAGWRRKFSAKEGELEALKVQSFPSLLCIPGGKADPQTTNAELAAQLSGSRKPGQPDPMEVRSLSTRAANAERRLNNAQNQLLATEEKVAAMNQRSATADAKWEARVKEYEARLKAAEERVKRERQGSKERVAELENNLKSLQRQFELAQKRNQQLNEVVEATKLPSSPPR
ncbi:hypothetical protein B0H11DRAFT_2283347 [Mycena galericulata]|nr:hypothetical protein B0H11DRAFT_2283347 [Mycena galericulata]